MRPNGVARFLLLYLVLAVSAELLVEIGIGGLLIVIVLAFVLGVVLTLTTRT